MKKFGIFTLLITVIMALAACSSTSEKTGASSSKIIEVSIDNASYVLAGKNDGVSEDKETKKGLLAVQLKVKNKTDSEVSISPYDDIKIYDGEKQLSPENDLSLSDLGIDYSETGTIGAEKVKDITVIVNVEKDKKYELGITPYTDSTDKAKEVKLVLDTKKYTASFNTLNDPAKALTAYIKTIYMDKESADYEKYVSADKAALQEEAKKAFKEEIQDTFMDLKISDEEMDKQYINYKSSLSQKGKINAQTVGNAEGKAVVLVEYSNVPLNDLYDLVDDYREEYYQNTGNYDGSEEYALSKFDVILDSIEAKDSKEKLEILMVKKDGKWTVDLSDDYVKGQLVDTFAAGYGY
ncbi:DUF5105 domain-containing protein [Bacillus sp. DNRA2]|uniref:DUF5105 domain-containing protein n=1 Tax=Bacillus sp. DNRA2 TaxID=2723053 RepID=UPI00145F71ED|nr:DUF5105 domain-containing protein [Bacillus sp. DNRA2]NMD72561.1 DUF5105 domain-containing protein [Bacillus sp. DNRA2]